MRADRSRYRLFMKLGDRDRPAIGGPGQSKWVMPRTRLIPLRGSDLSFGQGLKAGSFNASPGRELVCGNAGDRTADTVRRWAQIVHGEKLNCERRETASG